MFWHFCTCTMQSVYCVLIRCKCTVYMLLIFWCIRLILKWSVKVLSLICQYRVTTMRRLYGIYSVFFLNSWFPALCFYIITLSAEVVINPQGRCIEFWVVTKFSFFVDNSIWHYLNGDMKTIERPIMNETLMTTINYLDPL